MILYWPRTRSRPRRRPTTSSRIAIFTSSIIAIITSSRTAIITSSRTAIITSSRVAIITSSREAIITISRIARGGGRRHGWRRPGDPWPRQTHNDNNR